MSPPCPYNRRPGRAHEGEGCKAPDSVDGCELCRRRLPRGDGPGESPAGVGGARRRHVIGPLHGARRQQGWGADPGRTEGHLQRLVHRVGHVESQCAHVRADLHRIERGVSGGRGRRPAAESDAAARGCEGDDGGAARRRSRETKAAAQGAGARAGRPGSSHSSIPLAARTDRRNRQEDRRLVHDHHLRCG